MEYRYSEQQVMLKKALNSLLKKEMPFETFVEIAETKDGFSKDKWKKLADNGWLAILAQGEFQTLEEVNSLDLMYLSESIGGALFPGPFSLTAGMIVPLLSQLTLSEKQNELLLDIIAGEKLATAILPSLTDQGGTVKFNWPELINSNEEGKVTLTGSYSQLQFLQNSDVVFIPFTNNEDQLSVAIVNTSVNGVKITSQKSVDLSKPQGLLELQNVKIGQEDILSEKGLENLFYATLLTYFTSISGEIIGGADEVLARTVNYVTERKQFGVAVGSFQAVKHMIAEMKVEIEKARSYSIYINSIDGKTDKATWLNIISSRYFNTNMYKKICEDSIQLHGGMGFTWEESIHFWYKASMFQLYHLTHPALMEAYIQQSLLPTAESKDLQYHN
ncbi:acyl-CoA dehydrogenase family protein [Cytobacillus purgationiresistens]|uniref:Alkylation response protein AidB-like acyl-CoA dehydrogenase n=1 Tax=Cytobacillus purgationiresistens TaxID=863449 RepID=A0ABU0AG18_9BACI|nr:acyl-CoA dehydrogenase family protein [Cytobacillus purgationiresistens]MDQ0269676.1 alkylation response protein AidB-like acyl-CoA dehydrogenase [Cytobacillus purgationiresistens]